MKGRNELAGQLTPDVTRMFQGVLKGGAAADAVIDPYVRSASAPYHAATKQATDQIMRNVPAGGRQSAALSEAITRGALQRGQDMSQMRQNYLQSIMQMAMQLYGQQPVPISTTATQKPGLSFGLGPIQGTL